MATAVENFAVLFNPAAPASASITRCNHSVYDPHNKGRRAEHCSICNQREFAGRAGLVLPRASDEPLTAPAMRANVNVDNECPGCHSRIYVVVDSKTRECADCGEKYPEPRKRSHQ